MNNRTLYWEIIDVCNLKCRYCFYEIGMSKRKAKKLNIKDALNIIPEISNFFDKVIFTGGEPLLYPYLFELINESKKSKLSVSYITNGLLLTREVIEKSIKLGVDSISVSLDSFDSELNGKIRIPKRGNPTEQSEQIINNIKFYAKNYSDNVPLTLLQSICAKNTKSIDDMIQFAHNNNIQHLVHPVGIQTKNQNTKDIDLEYCSNNCLNKFNKQFQNWAMQEDGYLEYYNIATNLIEKKGKINLKCPMGETNFFIDVSGDIYPCFHIKNFRYGNIFKGELSNIVNLNRPDFIEKASCASLACSCMLEII